MKRQWVKFLWDLYWENKTYKLNKSIRATKYKKKIEGKIYLHTRTFNVKVHKSNTRVKRWHNKYEVLN